MSEKNKDEYYNLRPETSEDFKKKEVNINAFPKVLQSLSDEDVGVYNESLKNLQSTTDKIIEKLKEKCKDAETATIFISELNELLRKNSVK